MPLGLVLGSLVVHWDLDLDPAPTEPPLHTLVLTDLFIMFAKVFNEITIPLPSF